MKHSHYIALIIILFSSCYKKGSIITSNSSILEEIIIDPQKGISLSLDSLIEKVEYIKLETTDQNLIGKINQLLFTDSLIFIVDSESSRSINVFDLQGNFKHRIFHLGNGPKEYVEISNICIIPDKEQLAILDRPQHRIIYYKYNGEYVQTEQMPFAFNYFEFLKSGNKVYDIYGVNDAKLGANKESSLIVTDSINNIVYSFFKDIYNRDFFYTKNKTLRKFQEEIYYSPNITDTIYMIKDSIVEAKYHINITENNLTNVNFNTNEEFYNLLNKYYFFNGDYIELKDFTYVNIMSPWGYPSAIYVHSKKKTYLNSNTGDHPLFNFLTTAPKARYKENCIVLDVQSYRILALKDKLYKNEKYNILLDSLFKNLTEDSNPVLFFYHLNNNL